MHKSVREMSLELLTAQIIVRGNQALGNVVTAEMYARVSSAAEALLEEVADVEW